MDYSVLIGLLGVAVAIYFGLYFGMRGTRTSFEEKLEKIEKHTQSIKKIEDTLARLDERLYASMAFPKGTVEGVLKNIGKTKVTAEPGMERTKYYIEVEKPILRENFIAKKSVETWLTDKERELFGAYATTLVAVIDPRKAVFDLPSIDPKICSQYVTQLLKWLDSEYWNSLRKLGDYENISF